MKASICATLVILALASCSRSTGPEGIELLLNGDIEGGLSKPAYWGYFDSSPQTTNEYEFRWDDGEYRSSSHSLKISLDSIADPSVFAAWYQNIRIEPGTLTGKNLRLTAHVRLVNVTGNGVWLVIRADNPSGELAGFSSTQGRIDITGTKKWSSYSVELYNLSSEADEIRVFLLLGSDSMGTVYFDDISLIAKD